METEEGMIVRLRIQADGLAQLVKVLPGSANATKAHNAMLMGKAWLGKRLGELGTPTPYPSDGTRKGVEDIEKTADVMTDAVWPNPEMNIVEKIDFLREKIGEVIKEITWESDLVHFSLRFAYKELSEARFWLGFCLADIRKEHMSNEK